MGEFLVNLVRGQFAFPLSHSNPHLLVEPLAIMFLFCSNAIETLGDAFSSQLAYLRPLRLGPRDALSASSNAYIWRSWTHRR